MLVMMVMTYLGSDCAILVFVKDSEGLLGDGKVNDNDDNDGADNDGDDDDDKNDCDDDNDNDDNDDDDLEGGEVIRGQRFKDSFPVSLTKSSHSTLKILKLNKKTAPIKSTLKNIET